MKKLRTIGIRLFCIVFSAFTIFGVFACSQPVQTQPEPIQAVVLGQLRGKVLTDTGEMVTASIVVEDSFGGRKRYTTNYLSGYTIRLDEGEYNLYYTRGPEFSVVKKTVKVENYKVYYMQDVRLVRLYDSFAKGYIAGDLHQHTYYSDGLDGVEQVLLADLAMGLYYGFLTDHNTAYGLSEWVQGGRMTADIDVNGVSRPFSAFEGLEVTTEFGHYQSLGLGMNFDRYEIQFTDAERSLPKAQRDAIAVEKISYIGDTIRRNGGVAQINHPYSTSTMGFNYWDAAEHFDTIEIWNGYFVPGDGRYENYETKMFEQNYRSKIKWFELLNEIKNGGKFWAATGGTDNHDVAGTYNGGFIDGDIKNMRDYEREFLSKGKYNGLPATYAKTDGEITLTSTLEAVKNGHSFISNGPFIDAHINGAGYGETAALSGGDAVLSLEAFNRDGIDTIKIIRNGEVFLTLDIDDTDFIASRDLTGLASGDWLVLEVLGNGADYAITNPIFIG